ncbi:MAG: PD-(D/E)XK nuclease family protein, partial [Bacteroidales bacterium]|nr:PD-(D/E)XK nuclease family protein [Bacteroidales bacterium]
NLAYVSFTRPKERLYVYSSSPKAGSLSKALEDFCKMNCGEGALFREEEYMADLNEITGGEISGQYTYSEFLMGYPAEESYSRLHPERRDMLYSVSQVDASPLSSLLENVPVRARLRGVYDRDENVRKGILWHQLYSMIEEIGEDGVESAVSKAVERFLQTNPRSLLEEDFGGKEGGSCKEKLVEEVCSQIARVSDYKWFKAGVTVRAEATVLIGADMWRPDRVLLPKESGNKDWAVVVDYKFGKYDKDSPQCKAYERQVANYMRLLGKMGYRQVSGYLWYPLEEDLAPISCS